MHLQLKKNNFGWQQLIRGHSIVALILLGVFLLLPSLLLSSVADAAIYDLPEEGDLIGEIGTVIASADDTLLEIAMKHQIGYNEIMGVNTGIDPWLPQEGAEIILPGLYILPDVPRRGIVINLAEMRLYYFVPVREGETPKVITHPIGIGKEGWSTPVGTAKIVSKVKNPTWTVPASLIEEKRLEGIEHPAVIPPGPDNPLGDYAMRLSMPSYLIHGTNQPFGVGRRVSHGCIRMYPDGIEELFGTVPVNTPVTIVNKPYKAGYGRDGLYLEVHKPLEEVSADEIDEIATLLSGIGVMTKKNIVETDLETIKGIAYFQDGLPHLVAKGAKPAEVLGMGHWVIQVGAYTNLKIAAEWVERLKSLNESVSTLASLEDGMCHLIVGPFADRETTLIERERLESVIGIKGLVQRADRPGMLAECEL